MSPIKDLLLYRKEQNGVEAWLLFFLKKPLLSGRAVPYYWIKTLLGLIYLTLQKKDVIWLARSSHADLFLISSSLGGGGGRDGFYVGISAAAAPQVDADQGPPLSSQ